MISRVPRRGGRCGLSRLGGLWLMASNRTCSDDEGVVSGERDDGSSRDEVIEGGGEMGYGEWWDLSEIGEIGEERDGFGQGRLIKMGDRFLKPSRGGGGGKGGSGGGGGGRTRDEESMVFVVVMNDDDDSWCYA
ncbi:hypothetical protein Droror1_Dr00009151 [Drosera rotundifolia]